MELSLQRLFLIVFIAAVLWASTALSEPVRPYQRVPVDVRRTTLIVSDMERSLAFYRDALGLKLVYDQVIKRPAASDKPAAEERAVRMALLRANDTFVGLIGLLEYQNPRLPEPESGPRRPGIGDVMMVVNAKDLLRRFERVRATPGVNVASEPALMEYPAPGGQGVIPVMVSSVWDPDGYFIELSQVLDTPLGTEEEAAGEGDRQPGDSSAEPEASITE